MTFDEIKAKARKLDMRNPNGLGQRVDDALDSARVNADDTCYVEKEADPSRYDEIALGTLSSILAYSNDKAMIRWFERQGVRA